MNTFFQNFRIELGKGASMNLIIRISFMILSPVFLYIYWRNSFRQIDDLHANFDLKYAE